MLFLAFCQFFKIWNLLSFLSCLLNIISYNSLCNFVLFSPKKKSPTKLYQLWASQNLDPPWVSLISHGAAWPRQDFDKWWGGDEEFCIHTWAIISRTQTRVVARNLRGPSRDMRMLSTRVEALWSLHPSNLETLVLCFVKCACGFPVLQATKAYI